MTCSTGTSKRGTSKRGTSKHRTSNSIAAAAALTTLGLSMSAIAADTAYEMIAYDESVSGKLISIGNYEGAIELATKRLHNGTLDRRLMEHTNLCVAYTLTRSFEHAHASCEAALKLAREVDAAQSHRTFRTEQETAKAISNRGVLKAVTGDLAGASSDFTEAMAAIGASRVPDRNLARLEGAVPDRLAMMESR